MESPSLCKSIRNYDGRGGGKAKTLSFPSGVIIKVTVVGERGWCRGEYNSQQGWFPSQCVAALKDGVCSLPNLPGMQNAKRKDVVQNQCFASKSFGDNQDIQQHGETVENNKVINNKGELPQTFKRFPDSVAKPYVNHYAYIEEISNSESESDASLEETKRNVNNNQKRISEEKLQDVKILDKVGTTEPLSPTNNIIEDRSITKFDDVNDFDLAEKDLNESNGAVKMINGLAFPLMNTSQKLLRINTTNYCDHFWGDLEDSSGFYLVYKKIIKEKEMCLEMVKLLKARETLEKQYAKGLASISTSLHGAEMKGTLGNAWRQLKVSTKLEAQAHQKFASMLRIEVRQPLEELRDHKRKEIKKINSIIGDVRIEIFDKFKRLETTGHHYLELEKETQINVENNASEQEILKSQAYRNAISDELPGLMTDYNKSRQHWCSEVLDSCNFLEKEEINRVNRVSVMLTHYCKLRHMNTSEVNVSADILLQSLSKISPDEDREDWIKKNATGSIRPVDLIL